MYDPLHSPDCNHLKLLTRYLSGILEMPTFREDAFYKDQCFAVEKFCTQAVELIKDTDLTSDDLENEPGQLPPWIWMTLIYWPILSSLAWRLG